MLCRKSLNSFRFCSVDWKNSYIEPSNEHNENRVLNVGRLRRKQQARIVEKLKQFEGDRFVVSAFPRVFSAEFFFSQHRNAGLHHRERKWKLRGVSTNHRTQNRAGQGNQSLIFASRSRIGTHRSVKRFNSVPKRFE